MTVKGSVSDVRPYTAKWWLYKDGSQYAGDYNSASLTADENLELTFTVPADAKAGDYFNLILEARNEHKTPMTGYGQLIVKVI